MAELTNLWGYENPASRYRRGLCSPRRERSDSAL